MSEELVLWAGTEGLDAAALAPGCDLTATVSLRHGLSLPHGAALDDHLDAESRDAVGTQARDLFARWRAGCGDALVVEGLDLGHVWEVELLAQVFVPAAQLRLGLERCRQAGLPGKLAVRGFPAAALASVDQLATAAGMEVVSQVPDGPGGAAPIQRNDATGPAALAGRALRALGLPPAVRGRTVGVPYSHLTPVYDRLLARASSARPLPAGAVFPGLPPGLTARAAARNGWTGMPGARARTRAAAAAGAALRGVAHEDALTDALHSWALAVLEGRAAQSLAEWRHLRRAFRRGAPPLALVPWDSPDLARTLLAAVHAAGGTSLVVQHGFDSLLGDPDKRTARHAAVWTARDAERLRGLDHVDVHVTGNPAAVRYATARPRGSRPERAVVLVEYPARLSAAVPARVALRHVAVALDALERLRPGGTVIVRPHPSDVERDAYRALGDGHPGLTVEVDPATPIDALMESCDLCVGSLSTATLQGALLGVPTVLLDVFGLARPWPFDGEPGSLPRAEDADGLVTAATAAMRADRPPGQEAAAEAIGATADGLDRVAALVEDLAG